jgi:putative ABC transport system permease protein
VNVYGLRIRNPADAAEIGHRVDAMFDNSATPTKTKSDSEAAQKQFNRIGDVAFLARAITSAAFFALLVATGTLLMQSIRERTPELGVLKAVGFRGSQVATLVLAEGLVLAVCGALLGMALAVVVLPRSQEIVGSLSSVPLAVFAAGIACACMLAVASASIPAWRAARLNPADALADR